MLKSNIVKWNWELSTGNNKWRRCNKCWKCPARRLTRSPTGPQQESPREEPRAPESRPPRGEREREVPHTASTQNRPSSTCRNKEIWFTQLEKYLLENRQIHVTKSAKCMFQNPREPAAERRHGLKTKVADFLLHFTLILKDHKGHFLNFYSAYWELNADWCWYMLIDADWCWLMLTDACWCWLILVDADWCLLLTIAAEWHWLMMINAACRQKKQAMSDFLFESIPLGALHKIVLGRS